MTTVHECMLQFMYNVRGAKPTKQSIEINDEIEYTKTTCSCGHMHSSNMRLYAGLNKETAEYIGDTYCYFKDTNLDNNDYLDKFEIIAYDLKNKDEKKYDNDIKLYRDVLTIMRELAKEDKECEKLIPKYETILQEKEEECKKREEKENYKKATDGSFSKTLRNADMGALADFFREDWVGYQLSKLCGDNAFTDWLQGKNRNDEQDGKNSIGKSLKDIARTVINHPFATAALIIAGVVGYKKTNISMNLFKGDLSSSGYNRNYSRYVK